MQYSQNVVEFFTLMLNEPEQAQKFRHNRTLFLSDNQYPPASNWPTLSDQDKHDIMNMSFEDVNRWNYTFNTTNAQWDETNRKLSATGVQALHGNGIPFMNQVDLEIVITETALHVDVNAHTPPGEIEDDVKSPPGVQTSVVHIVGVISSTDAQPLISDDKLITIQPASSVTFDTNVPHYENRTHVKANGYVIAGTGNNDGVISIVFNENIDTPIHGPATEQKEQAETKSSQ